MKKPKGAKRTTSKNSPDFTPNQPASELVAALAYSIWEQEGRPTGRDVEHWMQAEAQLRLCCMPDLA